MNKKKSQPSKEDGWKGYVNYNPTKVDQREIEKWMGNGEFDMGEYLLQLSESGYSISFSHDDKSGCTKASCTGKGEQNPNKGYSLSVRATTPQRACALIAYYVYVICESQSWMTEEW